MADIAATLEPASAEVLHVLQADDGEGCSHEIHLELHGDTVTLAHWWRQPEEPGPMDYIAIPRAMAERLARLMLATTQQEPTP